MMTELTLTAPTSSERETSRENRSRELNQTALPLRSPAPRLNPSLYSKSVGLLLLLRLRSHLKVGRALFIRSQRITWVQEEEARMKTTPKL
jgi:hypothetical protein